MTSFNAEIVTSWPAFLEQVSRHKPEDQWIYRGHRCSNWDLKTSLERALQDWGQDMRTAHAIERQMIRDFQRSYIGDCSIAQGTHSPVRAHR
jgi:hypothetical protein